jgi:hypothetical protein
MSELGDRYVQTLDLMEDPENAAANRFFHQIMKLGRELNGFPAFARKYADCQNLEQVAERARAERDELVSQRDSVAGEVSDLRENAGALRAEVDELTVKAHSTGKLILEARRALKGSGTPNGRLSRSSWMRSRRPQGSSPRRQRPRASSRQSMTASRLRVPSCRPI